MGDVGQAVTTISAVAVGAGLAYLSGMLTRHHQEVREDRTRWYEARFKAYAELSAAAHDVARIMEMGLREQEGPRAGHRLIAATGPIHLIGSIPIVELAMNLSSTGLLQVLEPDEYDYEAFMDSITEFESLARNDLGHR